MQFNITSLEQLDLLFADFIQEKLGLQDNQVILAYTEKGTPNQKISDNRIYIHTEQELDERKIYKDRHLEDTQDGNIKVTQYTLRTVCLNVIAYGPLSDILLNQLNELIYLDSSKEFFSLNNLSLIPDRTSYQSNVHEIINDRWWHRSDLKLYFYNTISTEEEYATIDKIDAKLYTEKGEV